MIKIAIVEDDKLEAERIAIYMERYFCTVGDESYSMDCYCDADSFLSGYKAAYDIIFMDIRMPGTDGMSAAKKLRDIDKQVVIVFVTNMSKYAVKGYEVDALDFIVKPFLYESFEIKMNKILNTVKTRLGKPILIKTYGETRFVSPANVRYLEMVGHDILFHTTDGDFRMRGSLSSIEKELNSDLFFRCGSGYIVNMKYITKMTGDDIVLGEDVVRVSRTKKREFKTALANFLGRGI